MKTLDLADLVGNLARFGRSLAGNQRLVIRAQAQQCLIGNLTNDAARALVDDAEDHLARLRVDDDFARQRRLVLEGRRVRARGINCRRHGLGRREFGRHSLTHRRRIRAGQSRSCDNCRRLYGDCGIHALPLVSKPIFKTYGGDCASHDFKTSLGNAVNARRPNSCVVNLKCRGRRLCADVSHRIGHLYRFTDGCDSLTRDDCTNRLLGSVWLLRQR
jgi:hypothetical protein